MRRTFRISRVFIPLTLSLLLAAIMAGGCAHMPSYLGGPGEGVHVLDGEQNHEISARVGQNLILELRDPSSSGYVISGAFFDPGLLRMDGIVPLEGGARVRYVFAVLAEGECDIVIKIRKQEPGYRPEAFKTVHATLTK